MIVNVTRIQNWLVRRELFSLGARRLCELQHRFWSPAWLLDVPGGTQLGITWDRFGADFGCRLIDWRTRQMLARISVQRQDKGFDFGPVELTRGRLELTIFDEPTTLRRTEPQLWKVGRRAMPQSVSIQLFDDATMRGKIISRLSMQLATWPFPGCE